MAKRLRNFGRTVVRCWGWQLTQRGRLVDEGREPSRDLALVILRQRVRAARESAGLEARLVYIMPGGIARELVPIEQLLASAPQAKA